MTTSPSRKHLDRTRALLRLLATISVIAALLTPVAAHAVTGGTETQAGARTNTGRSATTPTFPKPASERVQPNSGGTTGAPSGTGGTGGVLPTSTATVPQTTATTPTFTATTPPPTATTTPAGGVRVGTAKPSAGSATGSGKVSTPALLAAVIAALLALACAIWSVARLQAFEPRWTLSLRHTLAEAGFRASATWAEFSDWARLGR